MPVRQRPSGGTVTKHEIDLRAADFMVQLTRAINAIPTKTDELAEGFYVSEVRIGFGGEDTGYRIIPNEFGDYSIAIETGADQ